MSSTVVHIAVDEGADPRPDIETREDCERLVRAFYGKALGDEIIGYLFTEVAKLDLESHVPQIASFWETILLGARTYTGGAFAPHAALHMKSPLRRGHFEHWLWLWNGTVDEMFAGLRAEQAKSHASRVAGAFHGRLDQMSAQMQAPPRPDVVQVTQHGGGTPQEGAGSVIEVIQQGTHK